MLKTLTPVADSRETPKHGLITKTTALASAETHPQEAQTGRNDKKIIQAVGTALTEAVGSKVKKGKTMRKKSKKVEGV